MKKVTFHQTKLKKTSLHYLVCGKGEPLIIAPATMTALDDWMGMVEFLAQRFKVHFFELPGHGKSTPFKQGYSSDLVAEAVGQLVDKLGYKRVSLLGYSFGGVVMMKAMHCLGENRVRRLILFAPCVSSRTFKQGEMRMMLVKRIVDAMKKERVQDWILGVMHNKQLVKVLVDVLGLLTPMDENEEEGVERKLLNFSERTLEAIIEQVSEVVHLKFEGEKWEKKFGVPCYLGMSINDPLLDFYKTKKFLKEHFINLKVKRFYFDYHAPTKRLTLEYLNKHHKSFLKMISKRHMADS